MFYDKVVLLCAKRGMTVNALTNELGLSNSTATKWRQGSKPFYATLLRVADYFDVDVEFLADERYTDYDEWLQDIKGMTRAEYVRTPKWAEEKTAQEDSLDDEFVLLAKRLTPAQRQRVMDFMRGMLA